MLIVGRWSPSRRAFRIRVFHKKRVPKVPAPRLARAIQAIDPATLELSGIVVPPAGE